MSSFNKQLLKNNESCLRLNGRIWYLPNTSHSPYPVVLMVHGNHKSTVSSEIGYQYLGTMLASQGFLAVSIDEIFFNLALPYSSTGYGQTSIIKNYDVNFSRRPEFVVWALILLETLKRLHL